MNRYRLASRLTVEPYLSRYESGNVKCLLKITEIPLGVYEEGSIPRHAKKGQDYASVTKNMPGLFTNEFVFEEHFAAGHDLDFLKWLLNELSEEELDKPHRMIVRDDVCFSVYEFRTELLSEV